LRELQEILLGLSSGAAQGVFEWLPVSSKTILLLIFYAFGVSPLNAYAIGLFLNGATSLAAAIYFRRNLIDIVKGIRARGHGRTLLYFLLTSTSITSVIAIPLTSIAANLLSEFGGFSMILIGLLFALTGVISWMRERVGGLELRETPTLADAVVAGVAQGFSALPGISRSGMAILALLLLRHSPRSAIRLSFLMSIPATLGGSVYACILSPAILDEISFFTTISAIITSLIVSLIMISTLIEASQRIKAHYFAAALAAVALLMGIGLI